MNDDIDSQWPIPDGLCPEGLAAATAIRDFLAEKQLTDHGGGGRFYSPGQWRDRGERYGTKSLLIVTHDGGAHACVFNLDYEQYALHQQLQDRLREHGLFMEGCTCWYTAVHRI